jgi:hypothetical protein
VVVSLVLSLAALGVLAVAPGFHQHRQLRAALLAATVIFAVPVLHRDS